MRLAAWVLGASVLFAQQNAQDRAAWNQPVEPFQIIGNVYYVGMRGVSSFLIDTPAGAILLDGGFPESVPLIVKNIAALHFSIGEVRILINSHAHYDHSGGLAALKTLSSGRLAASAGDAPVLERGRGIDDAPPVKVDQIIPDGGTVELGGVVLTAHITPGHTKGCTTWTMPVKANGKTYQVVFYCSTTVVDKLVNNQEYPEIVADYERSFATLRALPCDVFLAPHDGFFHRDEKLAKFKAGKKDAFVDPGELRRYVDSSAAEFHKELAKQTADSRRSTK